MTTSKIEREPPPPYPSPLPSPPLTEVRLAVEVAREGEGEGGAGRTPSSWESVSRVCLPSLNAMVDLFRLTISQSRRRTNRMNPTRTNVPKGGFGLLDFLVVFGRRRRSASSSLIAAAATTPHGDDDDAKMVVFASCWVLWVVGWVGLYVWVMRDGGEAAQLRSRMLFAF